MRNQSNSEHRYDMPAHPRSMNHGRREIIKISGYLHYRHAWKAR